MKKHRFKNIYENLIRKVRVCGVWTKITPSLPHSQLSELEIPFQTGVTKNSGLSLPPAPRGRAFFVGGTGCQKFSSCFKLLRLGPRLVELRIRDSFLMPSLHCGIEVLLRPWSLFPWLMKSWFHTRGKLRKPQISAPSSIQFLVLRVEVASERNWPSAMPYSPGSEIFCLGREAGHKTYSYSSVPKKLSSFAN